MDKRLEKLLKEDGIRHYKCGSARAKDIKKSFWTWRLIRNIFLFCFWVFLITALYVFVIFIQMPSFNTMLTQERKPAIIILDNSGKKIGGINDTYGMTVDIDKVQPYVWQAVIAIEDKRFFKHSGIDYKGLLRAGVTNLFAGSSKQGGSTITQQVAKNIFLTKEKNINRKIIEVIISYTLEKRFDKKQILNLYLNRVSLAGGKYGLESAAYEIFGKPLNDLDIWQAATLAAMLKAPSTYNPYRNEELITKRTKLVLSEMKNQGYITSSQYLDQISKIKYNKKDDNNLYRYFTDLVLIEVNSLIGVINNDITVSTTLSQNVQMKTYNALKNNLSVELEGAIIVLDKQGDVLALVGGKDYQKSQFNRAYNAKRQVGSAFKPFVYLAGFENGIKLDEQWEDSEIQIDGWNPKNYDGKYRGNVSLLYAFAQSLNTIPVKITKQIGLKNVINTAKKMGVVSGMRYDMTLALGSNEISLFDLSYSYLPFSNGGYGVSPTLITKIQEDNKILYQKKNYTKIKLMSDENYSNMKILFEEVIKTGTGRRSKEKALGGKTGTSSENKDAWFIAWTSSELIGIWIGKDDSTPMIDSITGGGIPALIFNNIVDK